MTAANQEVNMPRIIGARAYANGEVGLIAWTIDEMIEDCLGFEITRVYVHPAQKEKILAAWVPFEGQSNPKWKAQTTSVWPVQKLMWRDLTLRKRRDSTDVHPEDQTVKYRIRALVKPRPGLKLVSNLPPKNYDGDPVPLAYLDDGTETNEILVTSNFNGIRAGFTNGILAAQWLRHALEEQGQKLSVPTIIEHISKPGDPIRKYLAGNVIDFLLELLDEAARTDKAQVQMALYELSDQQLVDAISKTGEKVRLILSNSSKDDKGGWDATDTAARKRLHDEDLEIHDRMFNNQHIGHNKFAVLLVNGKPRKVVTGSTNWTSTGLCGQSNNAMIIDSPEVGQVYSEYWEHLLTDTEGFAEPAPLTEGTSNKQGPDLRKANAAPPETVLIGNSQVKVWFSPNTKRTTKGTETPPDLSDLFSMMRKANDAIFFAVFLPSQSGKDSIIQEAINLGLKDSSLLVYGAVSDPTAMPNYVPPERGADHEERTPPPATFDTDNVHVVRAAALVTNDVVGNFESELLKAGHAIIHDKIVVVDPLSENGFVALGSHNMGFKASYMNDENLVIIANNPELVQAYAVHVLDVYDHYRFRAVQYQMEQEGKKGFEGFLSLDSKWLEKYIHTRQSGLSRYLSQSAPAHKRMRVAASAHRRVS